MSGWSGEPGLLVRGLGLGGTVRVCALSAEGPAREVCRRHGLEGPAAQLAAEGLVAMTLLAATIKGDERLQVQIQGERPRFAFMGEVGASGAVRARLTPAQLGPLGAVEGVLLAIKWDGSRELYRGVAEIERGTLEGALHSYLTRSQQARGLVRVKVRLDAQGGVRSANGLLVERLPGPEDDGDAFERAVSPLQSADLERVQVEIAADTLLGERFERLDEVLVQHHCTCSLGRVEATLVALGPDELASLLEEQGQAEVSCNFCNERYVVEGPRLRGLLDALTGEGAPGH